MHNTILPSGLILSPDNFNMSVIDNQSAVNNFNIDSLIKKTHTVCFHKEKKRCLYNMSWIENADVARLETKICFINQLIAKIAAMPLVKQHPLTLISLGSAGLLTEYFLHQGLTAAGFSNLHWRFIDIIYAEEEELEAIEAFQHWTGTRVETFSSERDYFDRMDGNRHIAWEDRSAGGMILLCVNPPTPPSSRFQVIQERESQGCFLVRGKYTVNDQEANSVYFFAINSTENHVADKIFHDIKKKETLFYLDCVVKCTIKNGEFNIVSSQDDRGKCLYLSVNSVLEMVMKIMSGTNKQKPGADNLYRLIHIFDAKDIIHENLMKYTRMPLEVRCFMFMDYDVSLTSLHTFIREGGSPCLLASFDKNQFRFE